MTEPQTYRSPTEEALREWAAADAERGWPGLPALAAVAAELADYLDERLLPYYPPRYLVGLGQPSEQALAAAAAASLAVDLFAVPDRGLELRTIPEDEGLHAVAAERGRQDAKWGQQDHPDGTGPEVVWSFTGPASWVADTAKGATDVAAQEGCLTWRDVLLEEVAEAFAEEDEEALETELVQVAAVAVQWREAIRRRRAGREAADVERRLDERLANLGRGGAAR